MKAETSARSQERLLIHHVLSYPTQKLTALSTFPRTHFYRFRSSFSSCAVSCFRDIRLYDKKKIKKKSGAIVRGEED